APAHHQQAPAVDPFAVPEDEFASQPSDRSYYQQAKAAAAAEPPTDRYAFMPTETSSPSAPPQVAAQRPETTSDQVADGGAGDERALALAAQTA
ncbi:MAG: hypothetical protein GTO03_12365, partial [Planctomycetales bacterium]|nr:hypothetical protein [Planctomycetales bacterium]